MTTETTSVLETHYLPQGRKRASVRREILHYIDSGETALARFARGYVAIALRTSHDDNDHYFDAAYTIENIATASLVSAWAECSQFRRECETDLCHLDDERAGRDFWLTRNAHGMGFFDEPVNDELAGFAMQQLTRISESYGEVDLYIGDDRELHFSNERSFI
jgi:hypothetical protein